MKILVVTNDFPPKVGGVNYYVSEILRRFTADDVTILTSSWDAAAAFDAAYPHRVVRWRSRTLLPTPAVIRAVSAMVTGERPDVLLFGASFPLAIIGALMRRRHGVPYVACTHGLELAAAAFGPGRQYLRWMFAPAAGVTVVSHWVRQRLEPLVGHDTVVALVPSGIDTAAFRPDVDAQGVRRRHGLGDGPVVCCVSRLVARKGQDQIIRALPRMASEWPGLRFLIVGSGPYAGALARLAARVGVADRVCFAGEVSYRELPAYFRAGDVFAMPCRTRFAGLETEALGAVYLQAAAVGRPVIAGGIGGAPEAVRDGETGLVVDGRDVSAVSTAIASLLRDPARAQAMGVAGATWVHQHLTWDQVASTLHDVLVAAVRQPRALTSAERPSSETN